MVLGCEMFIKQPILLNVNTEKKNQLRSLQAGDLQLKTVYELDSVATAHKHVVQLKNSLAVSKSSRLNTRQKRKYLFNETNFSPLHNKMFSLLSRLAVPVME